MGRERAVGAVLVGQTTMARSTAAALVIAVLLLCDIPWSASPARVGGTRSALESREDVEDAAAVVDTPTVGVGACPDPEDEIRLRWPARFSPPLTTQAQRDRATSSLDANNTRRMLLKLGPLLLGDRTELVIGTIGGSVTLGYREERGDYPTLFAEGLQEALRAMDPNRAWAVVSRNGAQGGTGSGYFALCVNRHVAQDTDLVLVELNVNAGTERAYERLHRKILARPSNPAVLEVLVENWKERDPGGESVIPGEEWKGKVPLLKHYEIPFVAQAPALAPEVLRDSTMPGGASGPYDIVAWLEKEDVRDIREHYFISLGKHMRHPGHQMMAEMLMETVMVLVRQHPCKSLLREAIAAATAVEAEAGARGGIPAQPPFHDHIVERHTESCMTPKQIMHASKSAGWTLKDERSRQGEHKFGVISSAPGAWLNISLDTRPNLGGDGGNGVDGKIDVSHAVVTIAYLASYEHMGRVKGSCSGGCSCEEFTIDALWERQASELQLHHVLTAPPAEHCHVNLRIDKGTSDRNGEHKFKVLQVTVQEDFVENAELAGHEEGGMINNFHSNSRDFGEEFDSETKLEAIIASN